MEQLWIVNGEREIFLFLLVLNTKGSMQLVSQYVISNAVYVSPLQLSLVRTRGKQEDLAEEEGDLCSSP